MKKTMLVSFGSHLYPVRRSARQLRSRFAVSTLLLTATALLGPGGGFHAEAQSRFPQSAFAEKALTYACFQVTVRDEFNWLMDNPGGVGQIPYPGWAKPHLISPGLQDQNTVIGQSKGFDAVPVYPADYPIVIGGKGGDPYPPDYGPNPNPSLYTSASEYSIPNPYAYKYPYAGWQYPQDNPVPLPRRTMLTEIQSLILDGDFSDQLPAPCPQGTSSLLGPAGPVKVTAGYVNLLNNARRSIGMIQKVDPGLTGPDYPPDIPNNVLHGAKSFFDVYVEVALPVVANTELAAVCPSGAVLYNDVALKVVRQPIYGPPGSNTMFYTHSDSTPAVDMKFKYDQLKAGSTTEYWWHAGEVFGQLNLAGHGVFLPCSKSANGNWHSFIAEVVGTVGHAKASAPVGGMFPNPQYPWPSCTYSMTKGTNLTGQPLDTLTFTNTSLSAGYLNLTNFQDPISLPSFGNSATYTNANTVVNLEWSFDMINYSSSQAAGTVEVVIVNTNTPIDGVVTYDTELRKLDVTGDAFWGSYMIRESPTKASPGKHIVQPGCRIAGYFDVFLDLSSDDGVSWTSADAPVRLYLGDPPCGTSVEPLYAIWSGANIIIDWRNPRYTLQGSTSLNPGVWVSIPGTPPLTLPSTGPYMFYRLACH
jgi:hypothetical protein